ncbi:MAG: type II toxin-antitoxin system PemK/MazF family toxin [Gammaproteobacteria bacterium]|nr:type II toxin-antitoxin system PemK/MazF family toxin [Gammaproteobacteria bacterium]
MTIEKHAHTIANIRRGQVWTGNLNPRRGQEVGKVRPVLVIQGDWLSAAQKRTVVVLPLTSDIRKAREPLRITLPARDALREDSQVMVDQPRTLDRRRLGPEPLAELTAAEMLKVEESLLAVTGITNTRYFFGRAMTENR